MNVNAVRCLIYSGRAVAALLPQSLRPSGAYSLRRGGEGDVEVERRCQEDRQNTGLGEAPRLCEHRVGRWDR